MKIILLVSSLNTFSTFNQVGLKRFISRDQIVKSIIERLKPEFGGIIADDREKIEKIVEEVLDHVGENFMVVDSNPFVENLEIAKRLPKNPGVETHVEGV